MLMGGHKPPQDVMDFAKRARAADGLAGQVSKHHRGRVLPKWDISWQGLCTQAALPTEHHMPF